MGWNWNAIGLVCLRVLVGIGMATHGWGKILGGRMDGFAEGIAQMGFPLPMVFAWAAAVSELVGGVCLAVGAWTRVAAFFICCTMSVALFIRHGADPFSTKELAYLYWGVSVALMCLGGGPYTIGRVLSGKRPRGLRV